MTENQRWSIVIGLFILMVIGAVGMIWSDQTTMAANVFGWSLFSLVAWGFARAFERMEG